MDRASTITFARILLLAGIVLVYYDYQARSEAMGDLERLEHQQIPALSLVRDIQADHARAIDALSATAALGEEELLPEADEAMEDLKARFDAAAEKRAMPADRAECLRDSLVDRYQQGRAYAILLLEDPTASPAFGEAPPRRWCNPDELMPAPLMEKMQEDAEAEITEGLRKARSQSSRWHLTFLGLSFSIFAALISTARGHETSS